MQHQSCPDTFSFHSPGLKIGKIPHASSDIFSTCCGRSQTSVRIFRGQILAAAAGHQFRVYPQWKVRSWPGCLLTRDRGLARTHTSFFLYAKFLANIPKQMECGRWLGSTFELDSLRSQHFAKRFLFENRFDKQQNEFFMQCCQIYWFLNQSVLFFLSILLNLKFDFWIRCIFVNIYISRLQVLKVVVLILFVNGFITELYFFLKSCDQIWRVTSAFDF